MKRLFFAALLAAFLTLGALPAAAQRVNQMPGMEPTAAMKDRIIAVVNDNVITSSNVEERMKLAFLSSGLPDTQEVRQKIFPQVLHGLIDEQLQLQEAKRLDITVPQNEIDKTLEDIGHDNHIGDMRAYLQAKGGSPEALEQQIRAGLAWGKVVQRELRPRVDVGDDEIDTTIARLRANAGKQEFLVSEIFLAIDQAKDEDQVKQAADDLTQQIKGGANFAAVARQFSQSTGAASGGDIGWIQEGQLSPELNKVLVDMQAGSIAGPVRTPNGYHILALREKRTVSLNAGEDEPTYDLRQLFRPVAANDNRDAAAQEAQQLGAFSGDCAALESRVKEKFPAWHVTPSDGAKLSKAPGWLADKVRNVAPGKASDAINTNNGLLIVFVCNRHVPEGKVDRDAIAAGIGNEKLELLARRQLRDLRRDAYIDIRVGRS